MKFLRKTCVESLFRRISSAFYNTFITSVIQLNGSLSALVRYNEEFFTIRCILFIPASLERAREPGEGHCHVNTSTLRSDHKLKIWRDASWFPTLQVSLEETENCRTILFLYDASPEKEPGLERVWIREGLRGVGGRAREFHAHFFLCASSCFRCNLLHVRANTLFYIIWKLSRSERAWHPISTCFALNCLRAWPSRSTVEISREENCEK